LIYRDLRKLKGRLQKNIIIRNGQLSPAVILPVATMIEYPTNGRYLFSKNISCHTSYFTTADKKLTSWYFWQNTCRPTPCAENEKAEKEAKLGKTCQIERAKEASKTLRRSEKKAYKLSRISREDEEPKKSWVADTFISP
jgi:hypothetical protein